MPAKLTLNKQWNEEHIRWLTQLAETVPLAEGRMEICPSRLSAGFRFVFCLASATTAWAMVATWIWQWETDQLSVVLIVAAVAAIATLGTWSYGHRTLRAFQQKPDFVLSTSGLAIGGRLLRWQNLTKLEYRRRNLGGHVSHTCHVTLRDGGSITLDLDITLLAPSRVMLLIDFYASGAGAA